jgi:protein-S-isoprenylcysteine O-methyltransferase Ste14
MALFGLVYTYRINLEESALKAESGQEYIDYAKTVNSISVMKEPVTCCYPMVMRA